MKAYRVRDSALFQVPEIREFLKVALGSSILIEDVPAAMQELQMSLSRDEIGLFMIGDQEAQDWYGMFLAQWSYSAFNTACVVIHFYNQGSNSEARAVMLRALDRFTRDGGFTKIIGMDTNHKSQAFGRLFSSIGEPRYGGETFIFEIDGGLL